MLVPVLSSGQATRQTDEEKRDFFQSKFISDSVYARRRMADNDDATLRRICVQLMAKKLSKSPGRSHPLNRGWLRDAGAAKRHRASTT
jgi:hypothetical protein